MSNERVVMPEDYKDLVYRLTYFLLGKIAHFIPKRITPNTLTLFAFNSSILGSILLLLISSPVAYLYWAIFNFIWYILDALDGIHARLTNQTSEFGAFLDHFLDCITFLVMFSVFAVKFDLLQPLFIFIILLRFTAATSVFLVQLSTDKLHLPKFSGGLELVLLTAVMLLSYAFPHINPTNWTNNLTALTIINHLQLQSGFFMKAILLIYLIGIPINFYLQLIYVKHHHS